MLRVQMRRLMELSNQAQTLEEASLALRTLSLAALTINRLTRTQQFLGQSGNTVAEALAQALDELGAAAGGPTDFNKPNTPGNSLLDLNRFNFKTNTNPPPPPSSPPDTPDNPTPPVPA